MLFVIILFEVCKLIAFKYGFNFNNPPFTGEKDITEIIPNLLLLQSWLPFSNSLSFNYPAWSISVEYCLYMIFFVTLFFRNFKSIMWLIISLCAFVAIFLQHSSDPMRGFSSFFAGAVTYFIFKNTQYKIINFNKYCFWILEISLILLMIFLLSMQSFSHKDIIMNLLFVFVIFVFAFEKGIVSKILKASFFKLLGKLSYSIYLTHSFIILVFLSFAMVLEKILKTTLALMKGDVRYIDFANGGGLNDIFVLITLAIVILTSKLTYKFIEQKGQDYKNKFIK